MAALLENIGALPIRSVITTDPSGSIFVGGKKLSVDQTVSFRESMAALGDNHARKILRDQVAWLAVEHGVHKGLNEDMIMFAKAILWYAQEENNLIRTLSSTEED